MKMLQGYLTARPNLALYRGTLATVLFTLRKSLGWGSLLCHTSVCIEAHCCCLLSQSDTFQKSGRTILTFLQCPRSNLKCHRGRPTHLIVTLRSRPLFT